MPGPRWAENGAAMGSETWLDGTACAEESVGRVAQTGLADPRRRSVGAVCEPPVGACRFRCKTGGSRAAPTDGTNFDNPPLALRLISRQHGLPS